MAHAECGLYDILLSLYIDTLYDSLVNEMLR